MGLTAAEQCDFCVVMIICRERKKFEYVSTSVSVCIICVCVWICM